MDNKLIGFVKETLELDKIICGIEEHQISKMYKQLL